jgi:hypothetical protein
MKRPLTHQSKIKKGQKVKLALLFIDGKNDILCDDLSVQSSKRIEKYVQHFFRTGHQLA